LGDTSEEQTVGHQNNWRRLPVGYSGPICRQESADSFSCRFIERRKTEVNAFKKARAELEMKIRKYRAFARGAPDDRTRSRIEGLISELEKKLVETDE
jgi:hypothetical protein